MGYNTHMDSARLGDYTVYFENSEEYHRIKREVWGANTYYVELDDYPTINQDNLTILDLGANIGLTTLYYKKLYPSSKIVAVEPLPINFQLLEKNMFENQVERVTLENFAISSREGSEEMFLDSSDDKWYSTAGFNPGGWSGDQESERIVVETKPLSYYLETYSPQLVKMDIEGAEERAILSAKDSLSKASIYLIEFHPIEGQGMDEIVKTFEEVGFRISVSKGGRNVPWHKAKGLSLITAVKNKV